MGMTLPPERCHVCAVLSVSPQMNSSCGSGTVLRINPDDPKREPGNHPLERYKHPHRSSGLTTRPTCQLLGWGWLPGVKTKALTVG